MLSYALVLINAQFTCDAKTRQTSRVGVNQHHCKVCPYCLNNLFSALKMR